VDPRLALAALVLLCACDPPSEPAPQAAASGSRVTIPSPAIDPAAQKIDPELGPAYKALKTGRYDEVRRMVEQYTTVRGAAAHRGQAEFVVGLTYHRQQFFDTASEHFLKALQLEPGFLESYYYAGHALFNVGRLSEARDAFAVYARWKPDDPSTAFGQGLVEFEADAIDAAERFMKRAIELATAQRAKAADPRAIDGDLGRYHARLGDVHARRDDFARAKELYEKAAALRPESPEVWSKLANACDRLGDASGAKSARARAEAANAERQKTGGAPR
jgi:tetratricopeptide (TPR) repeat protein